MFRIAKQQKSNISGYVLLEALVALLIFALGLLGLIAFQAASTKIASDSRFRTEAAMLADELFAKMAASNIAKVSSDYASNGAAFQQWLNNRVIGASHLPNPKATPTFAQGPTSQTMVVTLVIEWSMPGKTLEEGGTEVKGRYETQAMIF